MQEPLWAGSCRRVDGRVLNLLLTRTPGEPSASTKAPESSPSVPLHRADYSSRPVGPITWEMEGAGWARRFRERRSFGCWSDHAPVTPDF